MNKNESPVMRSSLNYLAGSCMLTVLLYAFALLLTVKFVIPLKLSLKFDKLMHNTVIELLMSIKCFIKLNKSEKFCYNAESKINEDHKKTLILIFIVFRILLCG